jgi:hypothetical protein
MAASAGVLRALGQEYGLVKVMSTLYKEKTTLSADKIKGYLSNSAVLTALKKITDRPELTYNYIKAIFRLAEANKGTPLDKYYNFIFELEEAARTDIINQLATGSDATEVMNLLDMLMSKPDVPQDVRPLIPASAPSVSSVPSSVPSSVSSVPSSVPSSVVSTVPSSDVSTVPSAAAASVAETTSTVKKINRKVRPVASTASKATDLTSDLTALSIGFKIHLKDDKLNTDKYDVLMLNVEHSSSAKLLVVDIDSCSSVIYPVAIDLAPNSTNRDVLNYVVKVLAEASSKNLKCHTAYHVYTVKTFTSTDRLLYISIQN